jgi:putative oxygen-independent coproporphyrinogen III oxidase
MSLGRINVKTLAVYIHWPFCAAKCPYCDFNSHVRDAVEHARWKNALLAELAYYAPMLPDRRVTSIFFGGGTPSLMEAETVAALVDAVQKHWQVSNDVEITLEANPTSVEAQKFKGFKQAGINRVSLGIQSLQDEALQFLGRKHTAKEALQALEIAGTIFDRHTFDLIYARPEQTLAMWEEELARALTFTKGHVSLYQLTIEENTPFHLYYSQQKFTLPDEEVAARMYERTTEMTSEHGLEWYEVSNYAAQDQESRHNLSYWRGDDYIGIGPGAHGRYTTDVRHATRTVKMPEKWIVQVEERGHGVQEDEIVPAETERDERILMGLRVREGIEFARFREQTGNDLLPLLRAEKLERFVREGFLVQDENHIAPTAKGALILNHITHELLS